MKNSPLVSVVLPTYNRSEWLQTSIGSVLSQTYSHWKLIVWDDGSTDNTEDVVRLFNDERIRYFKGSNKGAAYARNCAIENSRGDYIAFLDSDDQWLAEKLSRQVDILGKYPFIDFLFGNYANFNLASGINGTGFTQNKKGMDNLKSRLLEKDIFQVIEGMPESLFISNFIATDTVMVKRQTLINVGKLNENLRNSEDLEYWWRMGLKGIKFAYLDEILINRNKPPDSLSSPSLANYQNCLSALDSCRAEALKNGRIDLVKRLKDSYRSAWLGLLRQYNIQGERRKAIGSFVKSCKYGMNWVSCFLITEAIFGYKNTDRIKRLMKIGLRNIPVQ